MYECSCGFVSAYKLTFYAMTSLHGLTKFVGYAVAWPSVKFQGQSVNSCMKTEIVK